MAETRADETTASWVFANLGRLTLYLAGASFLSASVLMGWETLEGVGGGGLDDAIRGTVGFGVVMFLFGGLGCIPGLAVWLVILHWIRARDAGTRRMIAIVTAPLVGILWLIYFAAFDAYAFAFVFGLFWPLGAGLVVRFRRETGRAA